MPGRLHICAGRVDDERISSALCGDVRNQRRHLTMAYATDGEGRKIWFDVQGDGDALALIGGSSLVHRQWDFMVPILRDHFKVILFDQRGAGLSDRTPSGISLDRWVDDLTRVLDTLGVEQTDVLSTSNGSLVAIRFGARLPERVKALVHYGIYRMTDQYRKISRIGEAIIDEFGIGNGSMGAYYLARMFGTPDTCEQWVASRFEENLVPDAWKAMHVAIDVDLTEDLENIQAPQLIMVGEVGPLGKDSDYASGSRESERFGPVTEKVVIPDTNGTFHVLTRPFECSQKVLAFLIRERKER
jgi:pimeloyl-ACP methyl ester carboxylesterase